MLNRCACLLTDKLCRRGVVEEQKRPVFIYGFELLMSTLSSMVSIFIFSLLLRAPYASLCFFVAFMGLRFFAGGYHAPTYRLCFITSNSIFVLVFGAAWLIDRWHMEPVLWGFLAFSLFILFWLSPVENPHHPISEATRRKNGRMARVWASLLTAGVLLLAVAGEMEVTRPVRANLILSMTAVAVMIVIPTIQKRRCRE